jgi:hypothetical protein
MTGFLASVVQRVARDSSTKTKCLIKVLGISHYLLVFDLAFKGGIEACINGDRDFINYNFLVQYSNSNRISLAFSFPSLCLSMSVEHIHSCENWKCKNQMHQIPGSWSRGDLKSLMHLRCPGVSWGMFQAGD